MPTCNSSGDRVALAYVKLNGLPCGSRGLVAPVAEAQHLRQIEQRVGPAVGKVGRGSKGRRLARERLGVRKLAALQPARARSPAAREPG